MAKRRKNKIPKNVQKRDSNSVAFLLSDSAYDTLCISGYTKMDQCPEVITAVKKIAELIGSMTIYLMANGKDGDIRIQNELSRQIDINPSKYMTRSLWMQSIIMNLLLYGDGNAVVRPKTKKGLLDDLQVIPSQRYTFRSDETGYEYRIVIDGIEYDPEDLLHFKINPDPYYLWKGKGYRIILKDIIDNLKQASKTKNAFMGSKWKPSVIVKVDGLTDEFASPEGRSKLLDSYIKTSDVGEPWLIPAEQFDIKEIRPLSLSDLAINDAVTLDKKTVASIFGIPPFLLGVDKYNKDEWNNFISSTILPIARSIEQELTRKLIRSESWYLKFNYQALMDYDIKTIADVYCALSDRGIATGNEVRNKLGMSPKEGLDDLKILENYIPAEMSGQQKKLNQGEE